MLIATYYFSKWVEVEAYANIKDKDMTKFVWKNIVCQFGFIMPLSQTMGHSLIVIHFENFVWN